MKTRFGFNTRSALARLFLLGLLLTGAHASAQISQTITGTPPASPITYSPGATFALIVSGGGSGNPVVVASTTPSVCTVSGYVASVQSAGTCTITANQAGNANYAPAPEVTGSVIIVPAPQAITGTPPASPIIYSPGATFALIVSGGGSGNPVVVASTTPSVCTVSGYGASVQSAGTCTITANQAGNANYAPAPEVTGSVIIAPAPQAITGTPPASPITYSPGATFALIVSGGGSGNPVVAASTTPSVCTVSGYVASVQSAGTCTITANQAGNANYAPAPEVTGSVIINKASQTITFAALPNKALSDPAFTLSATASSGLAVTFTSTTTSKCTVSGNTVTLVATGTCTIRVAQSGNVSYNAAANVNRSFSITSGGTTPQAITGFAPPTPITYSAGAIFTLSATGGGSGNPVLFASTTGAVCTVSGSTATVIAAGTCTLTANQAGNASYTAAPQVAANVVINKANQVITGFAPATPIAYSSGGTFALSASGGASGIAIVYASNTPAVCTVAGSTATIVTVGTCTLTANEAGNANYNAAPQASASVTINPAAQTIAGFTPATPIAFSAGSTFALSATGGASGNAVTFTSTTPGVCTVAGITATVVGVGTCTLTANQAGNTSYTAAAPVSANVVVNPNGASQTITFGALANKAMSDPPVTLSATASSGLPVTFSSTTPGVCGVAGTTVTLVSIGTCSLAANQPGSIVYNAAPAVTQSFTVTQGTQTIDFGMLVDRNLGAPPFQAPASASSALPVTLTSATGAVCTLSGTTVTIVAVGTCTVTASQAGNANYAAAAPVSRSFTVAVMTAQLFYVHADHLGTPRAITKAADNVKVWEWSNAEPFGNNAPNENPSALGTFSYNLRFPGQYFDAETATHYNYFRDYDPATGRYMQSDPIGLGGGINTYAYVEGNPLSKSDPTGLQALPLPPIPMPAPPGGFGAPGLSFPDFELRDWWYLLFNDRTIPKPKKPACGCTCICRADANDNMPGNIKPGDKTFAFGEATEDSCAKASKEAKRNATRNLGKQPKHIDCNCTN